MDMKAIVMKRNRVIKKNNPIAKWLRQRRYKMLVIKNKKKYNRKKNHERENV